MGLPENSFRGKIKFKFNSLSDVWYHNWNIRDIIDSKPGTIRQIINSDEDEYYLLHVVPDERDPSRLTICIEDQIEITNSLPVPLKLEYSVGDAEDKADFYKEQRVLNTGQRFSFNKFDPRKKMLLRLKLRGFQWSEPIDFTKFCGPAAMDSIMLKDYSNNSLSLSLKYQYKWKYPKFHIYCEYCVIDQSDLDIILVRRPDKKEKQISLAPGYSRKEDPDDAELPDLRVYLLDQKNLKNLALIKNKYTDFPTEVLPIGLLGTFRPQIVIQSLNKQSILNVIDLVLETKKIKMGMLRHSVFKSFNLFFN